jgi:hypothetical protein
MISDQSNSYELELFKVKQTLTDLTEFNYKKSEIEEKLKKQINIIKSVKANHKHETIGFSHCDECLLRGDL